MAGNNHVNCGIPNIRSHFARNSQVKSGIPNIVVLIVHIVVDNKSVQPESHSFNEDKSPTIAYL